jgi:hypothetical protein
VAQSYSRALGILIHYAQKPGSQNLHPLLFDGFPKFNMKLKITTDGQSASLSSCLAIAGFLCRVPSLTRGCICNLLVQLLLGIARAVTLGSEFRRTHDHIWDAFSLEGKVPVFISSRSRVTQLYLRALGSLFVASYDSQGYSGGILTLLHTSIQSGSRNRSFPSSVRLRLHNKVMQEASRNHS